MLSSSIVYFLIDHTPPLDDNSIYYYYYNILGVLVRIEMYNTLDNNMYKAVFVGNTMKENVSLCDVVDGR